MKKTVTQSKEISDIDINLLKPGLYQPRLKFDESEIEMLASSIRQHGILQPIVVRPSKQGSHQYEIIAGERRWRACKKIGFNKIPAIIRNINDYEAAELSLIENIERSSLTIVEEARAIRRLMDEFAYTQETVSERLSRKRSSIANILGVLELPTKVLEYLNQGDISFGHYKILKKVKDIERKIFWADKIIQEELSVKELDRLVMLNRANEKNTPKPLRDPDILRTERMLSDVLLTDCKILCDKNSKARGYLKIRFDNLDMFTKIVEKLDPNFE